MFALIESRPAQREDGAWTSRALALAIHAALITAGVALTRQVARVAEPTIFEIAHLAWPQPTAHRPAPCACRVSPQPTLPAFVLPMMPPIPSVDLPPVAAVPGTDVPGADSSAPSPGFVQPGHELVPPRPFEARLVDELPVMLTHAEPRYPEVLRQAGGEGRVVVEAVLDTTGRAEAGSLRIVSATHPLFADEAQQVVLGSRYRPARVAGRAVRVRIAVPVTFSIGAPGQR